MTESNFLLTVLPSFLPVQSIHPACLPSFLPATHLFFVCLLTQLPVHPAAMEIVRVSAVFKNLLHFSISLYRISFCVSVATPMHHLGFAVFNVRCHQLCTLYSGATYLFSLSFVFCWDVQGVHLILKKGLVLSCSSEITIMVNCFQAEFRFHWINQVENEMDLTTIHPENEVRAGIGFIALQTFVDFFSSSEQFSVSRFPSSQTSYLITFKKGKCLICWRKQCHCKRVWCLAKLLAWEKWREKRVKLHTRAHTHTHTHTHSSPLIQVSSCKCGYPACFVTFCRRSVCKNYNWLADCFSTSSDPCLVYPVLKRDCMNLWRMQHSRWVWRKCSQHGMV